MGQTLTAGEMYKVKATMADIEELVKRIVEEFEPEKVILFGSYARGDARDYSDVDLYVVMNFEGSMVDKIVDIKKRIKPGIRTDILVRTPADFKWRYDNEDFFLWDVVREGITMYDSKDVAE